LTFNFHARNSREDERQTEVAKLPLLSGFATTRTEEKSLRRQRDWLRDARRIVDEKASDRLLTRSGRGH
jgi:hypothetical protein